MVMNFVLDSFAQAWHMLALAGPWMLLGLVMAGLAKGILPDSLVKRHLGQRGIRSIVVAAIIGAPLPVCSCGVLPLAAGLKSQGAKRGPLASFLVATPETGIDSVAVTYALTDLPMTILRPVAAFFSAVVTGVAVSKTRGEPTAASPASLSSALASG